MKKTTTSSACSQKIYQVQAKDLPLSCPTQDMNVWNAHPKVYLPIEKTGKEICPYCGTEFILKDA
ncbi:MAG TPA: zinc-finger domain-containing protein [Legionellaceae bacterium]|nr:zinc-finger domain-containing protein [Legionellaceae bacterium]